MRQVDPQADPVTRTFKVRVAVNDPPAAMRLGATVSGRMEVDHGHGLSRARQRPDRHRKQPGGLGGRSRQP